MPNIIYVKSFKFPNKCATCGKMIPKGASGFWDKDQKGVNYHDNDACYNAHSKSIPPEQGAAGNTGLKGSERPAVSNKDTEQARYIENQDSMQGVQWRMRIAKRLLKEELGIDTPLHSDGELTVFSEILKQLYGELWLNQGFR